MQKRRIYSKQEKRNVVTFVKDGISISDVATQFNVAERTIRDWEKKSRRPLNDSLVNHPLPHPSGRVKGLVK